jgi:hypothetical protein
MLQPAISRSPSADSMLTDLLSTLLQATDESSSCMSLFFELSISVADQTRIPNCSVCAAH